MDQLILAQCFRKDTNLLQHTSVLCSFQLLKSSPRAQRTQLKVIEIFTLSFMGTESGSMYFTVGWLPSGHYKILLFFSYSSETGHIVLLLFSVTVQSALGQRKWMIIPPLGLHILAGQGRKVCTGNTSVVFAWWINRILSFLDMYMRGQKEQWNHQHYDINPSISYRYAQMSMWIYFIISCFTFFIILFKFRMIFLKQL